MGHSRWVGPIRSAYDDAERIKMRGTGGAVLADDEGGTWTLTSEWEPAISR